MLGDDERAGLTRLCLERVAGRRQVIVTISHFSTAIVAAWARKAAARGAALRMMMPPYEGAGLSAEEAAGGVPIMVQGAPLSGVTLSVAFLARMAREIEQVRLFKIGTPSPRPSCAT